MVGGVLGQGVVGPGGLAQIGDRFVVAGRAVEREARQVVLVAPHRTACGRELLQPFGRLGVLLQPEVRLGDHAQHLAAALLRRTGQQLPAFGDRIAVVALAERYLQQVVRHQRPVGLAARQRLERLPGTAVAALGVVDVGAVIACVVGIAAARANPREAVVGGGVVPFGELRIAHTDVVTFALRTVERLVVGPSEFLPGPLHVALRAVVGAEREADVVVVDRRRIARREVPQHSLGIFGAQFDRTGGQMVVDALPEVVVVGSEPPAGREKFQTGIAPAAETEERTAPIDRRAGFGGRGPGRRRREGAQRKEQRQDEKSEHTHISSIKTGKDSNKRGQCQIYLGIAGRETPERDRNAEKPAAEAAARRSGSGGLGRRRSLGRKRSPAGQEPGQERSRNRAASERVRRGFGAGSTKNHPAARTSGNAFCRHRFVWEPIRPQRLFRNTDILK